MAVITPNTDVILLKVPLEISDNNQLTFANATAQYNYFYGLPKLAFDKFTYQRKDNTIRVGALIDDLYEYNYVMYRNTNHSNKWFYAYITDLQYVSDQVTAISIKTDVWQTYQFDLTYKKVFVEREHVNDDTVGKHTVPEGIELGEYVQNGSVVNSDLLNTSTESNACYICFQVSDYPNSVPDNVINPAFPADVAGHKVGGVYSGLDYIMVLTASDANHLIACYDKASKSSAIVSIFTVPLGAINASNMSIVNHTSDVGNFTTFMFTSDSTTAINLDSITLTKPTTLDGYTPKNGKMKTYPFCYFYASNNAGTEVDFHWEDFSSAPAFTIDGVVSQGMSIKAYPTNYKKGTNLDGYTYGIPCGKLPICAWNTDYYVNWCTQNAINIPLNFATSAIKSAGAIAGGIVTGGAYGAIAGVGGGLNLLRSVADVVNQHYQASITPDQAKGNANCGDINMAKTRFGFTFYPMSVKYEYAKICDDYMSMFGYKVNEVKIPNVTGRTNWNYVKTIGCYIKADIPQDDLNEIKSLFDKGITFWHNPSTFMDYSQSNAIVS